MKDTLQVAIIGLAGVGIGGAITLLSQAMSIRAQNRHRRQEELRSIREHRRARMLDAVAGLLDAADIQSDSFCYSVVLRHVHHSQLLLDPRVKEERNIAESISRLAQAVHEYIPVQSQDIGDKSREAQNVLRAQAEVTERCRRIAWTGTAGFSLTEI
jgi:hypothetical protein